MKERNEEFFMKNSELSMEFSKYVIEHPEMDDLLTEEQVVVFLPEFDPALKEFNIAMGKEIESEGGKVVYVKVRQLSPKSASRLMGVEVGV